MSPSGIVIASALQEAGHAGAAVPLSVKSAVIRGEMMSPPLPPSPPLLQSIIVQVTRTQ